MDTTSGLCHSVSVTVSCAGRKGTFRPAHLLAKLVIYQEGVEGCHKINETSVSQTMTLLVFTLSVTDNLCADVLGGMCYLLQSFWICFGWK
jgi:hypothetical protein